MRKCLLILLLIALPVAALAEPLTQIADLTGTVCWPDGTDEDTAAYRYSYVYPQVAGDGETETTINIYYANEVDYALVFTIDSRGEEVADPDGGAYTRVSYRVTANDDDFFSVLVTTDTLMDGLRQVGITAQNFSRATEKPGNVMTLPYLLDILNDAEDDEWLRNRQTNRASDVVRDMVWDQITERAGAGETFPEDWTREMLDYEFFPEYDFYYSEDGLLVFFFQPYLNSPDMAPDSCYEFAVDIEDILDEM